jgi:predicted enzyme related to lactoylglutathione lyase
MLQKYPMRAYIPAKDLERARRFYEGKVGLKPKQVTDGGVFYEFARGTACFLYPSAGAGTSKASQAFWDVDDLERVIGELEKRGVEFEDYDLPGMKTVNHVFEDGGAKAAWFKDSEGNIMALVQVTA